MKPTLAAIAVALLCGGTLEAQGAPDLGPGRLVRISAPELSDAPAVLAAATADTIVVVRVTARNDAGTWRLDSTRFAVPRGHITGFEVQGSRSHVLEGSLIGGASMGLMTFVMAKATECRQAGDWFCIEPGHAGQIAASGAIVGAAIGALVGIVWRSEEWQRVPLDRLAGVRIAVVPERGGGVGLGLSLAF